MADILIVDGDPAFARSLQILLEDEGKCRVRTVTSPAAGLKELENDPSYRVVITDVVFSGGDILELLNSIRHLPARIIMLTAHPAALDRKKAGFLGAEHYFVKPVDPEELLRAVLEAVEPGGLHNSVQSGT